MIWAAFLGAVAIAIWSAPRGFEFLDTGCYFLEYKFPHDVSDTHTTYHLFARPFFLMVGESVVGFRYVSWALVWAATVVLAIGWKRHLDVLDGAQGRVFSYATLLGIFLLVACANYTIKPAALTYNSLNYVAMSLALGGLFGGCARLRRDGGARRWAGVVEIASAAGVALVDMLIKPTTAAYVLGFVVLYAMSSLLIPWQAKKRLLIVGGLAAAVGLSGMIAFVGGVGPFLVRARTLTGILENQAFMQELNTRTLREFRELGSFLVHDLRFASPALVVAGIVLLALRWKPILQRRAAVWLGGLVFALWLASTVEGKLWRGSHGLYFEGIVARLYVGVLLLASGAALISRFAIPTVGGAEGRPARRATAKLLLWVLLVVLPFAGAYGSTTSMYLNGALYSVCWLAATLLALGEIATRWGTGKVVPFVTVPLALFAVAQLYHGQIYLPYMSTAPLWTNTVPTAVGNEHSIVLLDPESSAFINYTRNTLNEHGFKPGDDIFCFFNVPGLVYAVGGRSPVAPWYFGRIYVGNPVEESQMQAAGPERRRRAWLITQAEVTQFRDHFHRGGIDFPEGYEQIGSMLNPQSHLEVKIWKPRSAAP
ncbi:hypothetical protein DB347_11390 [Opitutaceae bacterium EW11]|nr:hypothetical protein DB347_11390 [Opitutaceae bacterium EW11]